jgi:O-antigen/teichoic acid export membrane protein
MTSATISAPSLRTRMISATQWVVLASGLGHLLRLASNLIVTRLLVPEMFGLMSVATTVGTILAMLSDIGLQQAVIRSQRGNDKLFLDTVWVIQILRGFVLFGGSLAVAVALMLASRWGWVSATSTYGDATLPWLIAGTGLWAVLNGFSSTLVLTSIRNFQLRPVFLLEFFGQLVCLAAMVLLAWLTHSIWALVLGAMVSSGFTVVLSHVLMKGERNRLRWDKTSADEVFSYGKWLAVSSAITVLASNADRLMLAGFATATLLGLYSVALSLVGALDAILTQLCAKVMLPALSEVARSEPARLPQTFVRLRWRIDPIILVSSGALFAAADWVVGSLYDTRYAEAGQMLRILSLGMIVSRYALIQQVFLAMGKTRYFVPINALRLVATFTLIPLGYYLGGFTGALVAVAFRDLPSSALSMVLGARHKLNDLTLEVGVLLFWPVGLLMGKAGTFLLAIWFHPSLPS